VCDSVAYERQIQHSSHIFFVLFLVLAFSLSPSLLKKNQSSIDPIIRASAFLCFKFPFFAIFYWLLMCWLIYIFIRKKSWNKQRNWYICISWLRRGGERDVDEDGVRQIQEWKNRGYYRALMKKKSFRWAYKPTICTATIQGVDFFLGWMSSIQCTLTRVWEVLLQRFWCRSWMNTCSVVEGRSVFVSCVWVCVCVWPGKGGRAN
jgi:hypothetical protein